MQVANATTPTQKAPLEGVEYGGGCLFHSSCPPRVFVFLGKPSLFHLRRPIVPPKSTPTNIKTIIMSSSSSPQLFINNQWHDAG